VSPRSANTVSIICCSIFKAELNALSASHWPRHTIHVVDSILHMRPQKLSEKLVALVEKEQRSRKKILLIYGDCCSVITSLEARPGVVRTRGHNCCYLLLGLDRYRQLSHEGAFFILPEWIHRWQEVFRDELGLDHEHAVLFMGEMHRKLVYLDTGVIPVPLDLLRDCATYCGLPFEVLPTPLDTFREAIETALSRLETSEGPL